MIRQQYPAVALLPAQQIECACSLRDRACSAGSALAARHGDCAAKRWLTTFPALHSRHSSCSADFPETGGASIREMASEIGHNIGEKLGVHQNSDSAINSKADEAMSSAADKVADSASSVVEKAREAVTGSKDRAA
jgi:hypothetical protein